MRAPLAAGTNYSRHLYVDDVRANWTMARWRVRRRARVYGRFVRLLSSQVNVGAFEKRSPTAHHLNKVVRRAAEMEMADFLVPVYAYVRSEDRC